MNDLFVDTETSGLARQGLRSDDPSQPHLLQLSAKLVDRRRRRMARLTLIVRPDGWTIEPDAEAHHRITEAMAYQCGVPVMVVLASFKALAEKADRIIAHHMEFDRGIVDLAIVRLKADPTWWRKRANNLHCSMELSAPLIGLPGTFGPDKYPSLEEAHAHFFPDQRWKSNHDGEADCEACERVWYAMEDQQMRASET